MILRVALLLVLSPLICLGQVAIPKQDGRWVHDEANVLSESTEAMLGGDG